MVAGLNLKSIAKSSHPSKIIMAHYNRSRINVHRWYDSIIIFGHIVSLNRIAKPSHGTRINIPHYNCSRIIVQWLRLALQSSGL